MSKTNSLSSKKRYGQHHNHGKHYVKVYFPYLPAIVILVSSLILSGIRLPSKNDVLAYATNISSNTLLSYTNEQRKNYNRGELTLNSQLSSAAQSKANDMVARNYWSHNTPDGQEPWIFIQNTGYEYQKAGENLAYGFMDSGSTVTGWMNSETHKDNLLDESFTDVGFGFANSSNYQSNGPETIVVAMYGRPIALAATPKKPNPATAQSSPKIESSSSSKSVQQAVNTDQPVSDDYYRTQITRIQLLTKGQVPWALFAVGLVSGVAASALLINHGFKLRKLLKRGESFIIHHPVLDVTMVSLIVLCLVLSQNIGIIK